MQDVGKKRYNILYTTSFGHMMGGGQWSLYYLIKHINKEIFHPIVLCPDEGELAEKMRAVGAEVIPFRIGRIGHLNLFVVWRLISIFKKGGIDIIHTDSTTETLYAGIAARLMGISLIWHIRTSEGEYFLDRVLSLLSRRLILVAKAQEERFKWLRGKVKMVVIYNGIDLADFDKEYTAGVSIRGKHGIPPDTIVIGCIGRIEEKKGQEYLINAVKDINRVVLLLIGDGDENYMDRLKRVGEYMGVSDRVIYTGPRRDIPALLRGVDIVVSPSLTEGFSRVVLEAMAGGRPVIATDVGGNPEAVMDGAVGYIIPKMDSKALADRIIELVNDKEKREEMGLAGRKRVEEFFNIQQNVKKTQELYLEILEKKE